jgi:proline dehydrogenase
LLEKISQGHPLNDEERRAAEAVEGRLTAATQKAAELGVSLFVDAEQSWMQRAIDDLVDRLMETYNRDQLVVYNTFQLYRTDRLDFLKKSHARAREKGYLLGAKLVRGAYMDKERERAREMGYPSPIQPDKASTDRDYNAAVAYCLEHYEEIALCNATHNLESCRLMAEAIVEKDLPRAHPHLNFCQLMGMSDYITFNLAEEGFNVAKYVPYGPVVEVVPYLVRRAQENASVTGEMSRELTLINREMVRRGLLSK